MKQVCALLAFILLASAASTSNATEIRIRNDSTVELKNVVVGDKKYGDIKPGRTTDYQHWEGAYRYSFVSLLANSKPLTLQPIDYVGESLLGEGKFTYILTLKSGYIDIRALKDAPQPAGPLR